MAKLKGVLKLVGTLEGLTIYQTRDGYVVKKKWGPGGARLKSDPAYKKVRHHQLEFGACARAAKLLRDCLMPVLEGSLDNRVSSRLNKVMNSVKNLDTHSAPGKRRVSKGFATPKGCTLLKGFEFNIKSSLSQIFKKVHIIDRRKEEIGFEALDPEKNLHRPKSATHVVFQCGLAMLDPDANTSRLKEDSVVLPIRPGASDLKLSFKTQSKVKGMKLLVLKVAFLQEVNGEQSALSDGDYNAVAVVDVWY